MRKKNKLVFGVGVNDADHIRKTFTIYSQEEEINTYIWKCPIYLMWVNMLQRSYSPSYKNRQPTYKDVTCCEEWKVFSNFKAWVLLQDWKGKQIDKDILVKGNKVYSPDTCAFVLKETNYFLLDHGAHNRGESLSLGLTVVKRKKKGILYRARCGNPFTGKQVELGLFENKEDAHEAWRVQKEIFAKMLAEREHDIRVKDRLRSLYTPVEWYNI